MPKYCNYCKEMVYSTFCPYCERKAGEMDYDNDTSYGRPEVNEGLSDWGGDNADGLTVLDFDDVFGTDTD